MKKISYAIVILLGMLLMYSCEKGEPQVQTPESELIALNLTELSSSDVLSPDGGTFELKFRSSSPWTAAVMTPDASWLSIDKPSGEAGENLLSISTLRNPLENPREAHIRITSQEEDVLDIRFIQKALIPEFEAQEPFPVNCLGGEIRVRFKGAEQVTAVVKAADWLKVKGQEEKEFVFLAAENTAAQSREAEVELTDAAKGTKVTVKLKQDAYIEWIKDEFYRRSLLMKFTGSWCSACPAMSNSIEKAQEQFPDRILTYSVYDAQSDKEIRFLPTDMYNYYKGYVSSFPTGIIDGRIAFGNAVPATGIVKLAEESIQNYPAICTADIVSSLSGNKVKIDLKIYCKKAGKYKVAIALVENGFLNRQNTPSGYNMEFIHNHVLRGFATAEEGDALVMENSGTRDLSYELEIPKRVSKIENCELILYFFAPIDKNVTELDYKSMKVVKIKEYVDNAIKFPLNGELKRK